MVVKTVSKHNTFFERNKKKLYKYQKEKSGRRTFQKEVDTLAAGTQEVDQWRRKRGVKMLGVQPTKCS